MKLIKKEYNPATKHTVYRFAGIKLSIKDEKEFLRRHVKQLEKVIRVSSDITKYPPAEGELRKHQLKCSILLEIFNQICKKHNLSYWIDSGTLLGAYRHKGFIPWDDDVDVCMLRDDYNKILKILYEELENTEFTLRERAFKTNNFQIRIYNKFARKVALDIFPVDKFNRSNLTDLEKQEITKDIKFATEFFHNKYNVETMDACEIAIAKSDIANIQNEYILKNQICKCEKPALFFAIDFPCDALGNLILDYDTVFPLKEIEFEGKLYPCPNNNKDYLGNYYGNFMEFPENFKF